MAVIYLAKGIRSDEIKRLTKSKRLTQEECFKDWSRTYDGSPSKLTALKTAAKDAYESAAQIGMDRDKQIYDARGELMKRMRWEGNPELLAQSAMLGDAFDLTSALDARLDADANEEWESFLRSLKPLSRQEQFEALTARYAIDCPNAPEDEIEFLAAARIAEMEQEEEEEISDEELLQMMAETAALWDDIPERPKLGAIELNYHRRPEPEPISDAELVQRIYQERLKKEEENSNQ